MTSQTRAASERPAFIRPVVSRLLTLGLLATIACGGNGGGDKSTGPTATVEGNYNLSNVDGNQLPVEVYHGPWFDGVNKRFYNQRIVVVKNGVINLDDTDRWAMTFDVQVTLDGATTQQTWAINGSYEIDGDEIVLSAFDVDADLAGTIRKGTISLTMDLAGSEREKSYSFMR
jgi:hypothetical protein